MKTVVGTSKRFLIDSGVLCINSLIMNRLEYYAFLLYKLNQKKYFKNS